MDLESDDETLRKLALGDSMDYASWPLLLCDIVARIEKIAHNDFPIPVLPAPTRLVPLPMPRFLDPLPSSDPIGPAEPPRDAEKDVDASPGSSQETNKENANPTAAAQDLAAAAAQPADPGTTTPPPSTAPEAAEVSPSQQRPALPPQIAAQLTEITSTLTKGFPSHPPHTIQRLAELVLRPRQHYRSLPSYLHAVDRVVQVASGAHVFPLPPAAPDPAAMAALASGVLGGTRRPSSSSATPVAAAAATASPISLSPANSVHPGSDEALGGALLTPIPWLARRAESVDGADAALSPEPDMMDGGSSDDGLSDTSGGGGGSAGSHQPHDAQHHGSGRPRQQQRLSTESTETIEGPNGVGHIETVSVSVNGTFSHHGAGAAMAAAAAMARASASASSLSSVGGENQGVTQGELIREEQRHGVVPANQSDRRAANARSDEMDDVILHGVADGGAAEAKAEHEDEDDEAPHQRGPEQIGLADTGPQAAGTSIPAPGESAPAVQLGDLDVEAAGGRPRDAAPAPASDDSDSVTEGAPTPKREADSSAAGGDQGEPPAKKVKGDQGAAASDASAKQGDDARVDSDGDVLITDDAQPST